MAILRKEPFKPMTEADKRKFMEDLDALIRMTEFNSAIQREAVLFDPMEIHWGNSGGNRGS